MTAPARKLEPAVPAGFLAKSEKGDPVTRSAQCVCGQVFQQSMLNPAMLSGAKPGIQREFMRQIPDGYVPVYCPACESKELGRLSNRVHFP